MNGMYSCTSFILCLLGSVSWILYIEIISFICIQDKRIKLVEANWVLESKWVSREQHSSLVCYWVF